MRTIWKFEIKPEDTLIRVPCDANEIHVGAQVGPQGDSVMLWMELDTDTPPHDLETRHYKIFGTGWRLDDDFVWIGTTTELAPFVWHVYRDMRDIV